MIKILLYSLLIFLVSCSSDKVILWGITDVEEEKSDLLYMAESTNVPEIPKDSLQFYLNIQEIVQAEKVIFKNFGKVHQNETFRINILLRIGSKSDRDYKFLVRTYNNDSKLIDSFELAEWVKSENSFCYGDLNKKLIIRKKCKGDNSFGFWQVLKDGRIVMTSYHGRK